MSTRRKQRAHRVDLDRDYLRFIDCSDAQAVRLVEIALRLYNEQPTNPFIIDFAIDAAEDEVGLDMSRRAERIVAPLGRAVRVGIRERRDGEIDILVVNPNGP
jgi:hypothetical protein